MFKMNKDVLQSNKTCKACLKTRTRKCLDENKHMFVENKEMKHMFKTRTSVLRENKDVLESIHVCLRTSIGRLAKREQGRLGKHNVAKERTRTLQSIC